MSVLDGFITGAPWHYVGCMKITMGQHCAITQLLSRRVRCDCVSFLSILNPSRFSDVHSHTLHVWAMPALRGHGIMHIVCFQEQLFCIKDTSVNFQYAKIFTRVFGCCVKTNSCSCESSSTGINILLCSCSPHNHRKSSKRSDVSNQQDTTLYL